MDSRALSEIARGLPDVVVVFDGDARLKWANAAAEALFEVRADDLVGTSVLEFVHPDDRELAVLSLASVQGKDVGTPLELRVRAPEGWRLVEVVGSSLLDHPEVAGVVLSVRDLTERRRWEVAGSDVGRFRSLVHNAASMLMLLDAQGRVESVSAAITRLLGHDQELVERRPLADLVTTADRPLFDSALARALTAPSSEVGPTVVHVGLSKRGQSGAVPFELSIVNLLDDPTVHGLVVSGHDITQLRAAQEALQDLAVRDVLTGLPNRALILDRAEQMLARARRTNTSVAALFIDLDGFKDVNDTLGHRVGDKLLRLVADRLASALRASDTIGRLGGDEFVVLAEGPSSLAPDTVARRLLAALEDPVPVDNEVRPLLHVSASIGIVSGVYDSAEELLRDADIALYEAKAAGRNRFVTFHPSMRATFQSRFDLERDLRLALSNAQFFLMYQPIVDLGSMRIEGFEALLRWRHPGRGVLEPADFMTALEQSDMITDVGRFVLETACVQAQRWRRRGHAVAMSVNVSARQFETDGLVDDVRGALQRAGLDPTAVVIEMTETALMRNSAGAAVRLEALKEVGVRIAIDDFGTGYSSLSYLQQFPVDVLKIDRTFVAGMSESSEGEALVHALIQLGKALGLETLAEGIEHHSQLQRLRSEECDGGQGYLFSRPLEVDAAGRLLAAGLAAPVAAPV